jgi:hypothetical protein
MSEYVSRCQVEINGQEMTDFKRFVDSERELRAQVNLMNKTGHHKKTPRYQFSLDYVEPAGVKPFNFDDLKGATMAIEKEGGNRVLWSGVCVLKIGEAAYDGESESVKTVSFGAASRREE